MTVTESVVVSSAVVVMVEVELGRRLVDVVVETLVVVDGVEEFWARATAAKTAKREETNFMTAIDYFVFVVGGGTGRLFVARLVSVCCV